MIICLTNSELSIPLRSSSSLFVPAEISCCGPPFPQVPSPASLRQNSNGSEMLKCGFFGVLECALKLGRIGHLFVGDRRCFFLWSRPKKRGRIWNNLLGSPSRPLGIQFQGTNIAFLVLETYQGNSNWVNPKGGKPVGLWVFGRQMEIRSPSFCKRLGFTQKKKTTLRKLFTKNHLQNSKVRRLPWKKCSLWIRGLCWNSLGAPPGSKNQPTEGFMMEVEGGQIFSPPMPKPPRIFRQETNDGGKK